MKKIKRFPTGFRHVYWSTFRWIMIWSYLLTIILITKYKITIIIQSKGEKSCASWTYSVLYSSSSTSDKTCMSITQIILSYTSIISSSSNILKCSPIFNCESVNTCICEMDMFCILYQVVAKRTVKSTINIHISKIFKTMRATILPAELARKRRMSKKPVKCCKIHKGFVWSNEDKSI